jgi:Met-zincin
MTVHVARRRGTSERRRAPFKHRLAAGVAPWSHRLGPVRTLAAGAPRQAACAALLVCSACGGQSDITMTYHGLSSPLTSGADFVSVQKAIVADDGSNVATDLGTDLGSEVASERAQTSRGGGADVLGSPLASGDFYIAIKKNLLGSRWFLTAYMKQFYPDFGSGSFGYSLGTRVVSFKTQNDRLFVFDASKQFDFSAVSDPALLVETYPIVHQPEFESLPGADGYVLFDPAQGLNKFSITGNIYADPNLSASLPIEVGGSYMQNFHTLADGAAFEQVFSGEDASVVGAAPQSLWGTLGVALRRYSVGAGYEPIEDPGTPFYFQSPLRSVPDSNGELTSNPTRWNIHPGMQPIDVLITAGAQRAQADFPDADILGALERGVEDWNETFGFQALRAVFVDNDSVPDDDANVVLIDYPGVGTGFAFGDWRNNPDNGEIRGGSVYVSGVFFDIFQNLADDALAPTALIGAQLDEPKPNARGFTWGGMPTEQPRCFFPAPTGRPLQTTNVGPTSARTAAEKGSRFIQHILTHEVGHVLGLRHNFKGSLVPPSSSVMDYLDDFTDAISAPIPQAYDRDAIRYLYGLSPDLPAQPFCTDQDTALDPNCTLFDAKANPLSEWWQPRYTGGSAQILSRGLSVDLLDSVGLNAILGYARDAEFVTPGERVEALHIALGPVEVPFPAQRLEDTVFIQTTNLMADYVLRRAVLDPVELRGAIAFDLTDADVIAALSEQAGRMLVNEDRIRSYELRRTTVDVLKALQAEPAFLTLRSARDTIQTQLEESTLPTPEVPLTEDLLARIEAALAPYFD